MSNFFTSLISPFLVKCEANYTLELLTWLDTKIKIQFQKQKIHFIFTLVYEKWKLPAFGFYSLRGLMSKTAVSYIIWYFS